MTDLTLQESFPDASREEWRSLVEKGLRGAEFASLQSVTEDGLARGPLFDASARPEGAAPLPRTDPPLLDGRPWHVCAPVMDSDLAYANEQLLADLKGGASAVQIMDTPVTRRADLKRLLEGVFTDLVPILFAPGSAAAAFAAEMDSLSSTSVTLGLDPAGDLPDTLPPGWRAFTIDARAVHEAGGTDVLELASFAASAAQAFRRHGPDVHDQLSALFALGPDAHLNIVKIRAARRLYARIAGAFGIEDAALPIHAISSLRMMQSEDAWTNLLRTMSAGFGGIAGGADYVTLRPFTETPTDRRLGRATDFGHRIARNQQLLMLEESHLGQVRDPAHGSYFHDRLTEDLAQSAWAKFQTIEAVGGYGAYQESGQLAADCEAASTARAERADPILGVTLHPSDDVPAPDVRTEA